MSLPPRPGNPPLQELIEGFESLQPQYCPTRTSRKYFLAFWVARNSSVSSKRIADDYRRALSQVCEMLLYEGVEAYKKEGPKFLQRLVAKQKAKVKDS